jgi:cytochrome c oxidase cbb3-type subunit 3
MTHAWSWYIVVLTVANVIGVVWLLLATAKRPKSERDDGTTGHIWDEDLTEYNHALPRWWFGMFLLSVLFSAGYLFFYPGLGANAGSLGWTSAKELKSDLDENNRKLEAVFARYRGQSVEALAHDAQALVLGHNVFANNCAVCHGSDARGAKSYPNLTDADWLYGGTSEQVLTTILSGRNGTMPPLGAALGEQGVNEVANYVLSLSGGKADLALVEAGKARFALCAACHGPDGKGNTTVGAPNLTDSVWLYGGTLEDIKTSIRDGRSGKMPAWEATLGKDRARLVAAWVLAQSQRTPAADVAATAP